MDMREFSNTCKNHACLTLARDFLSCLSCAISPFHSTVPVHRIQTERNLPCSVVFPTHFLWRKLEWFSNGSYDSCIIQAFPTFEVFIIFRSRCRLVLYNVVKWLINQCTWKVVIWSDQPLRLFCLYSGTSSTKRLIALNFHRSIPVHHSIPPFQSTESKHPYRTFPRTQHADFFQCSKNFHTKSQSAVW